MLKIAGLTVLGLVLILSWGCKNTSTHHALPRPAEHAAGHPPPPANPNNPSP
ncbi:MAG: hypothetical protein RMJ19_10700 [Gemmatales bacterium]|nr:hypothetical protein [Gemmatales bacterium]MCS7160928.1 hypothetical protein [Gemmatales bacterium]MDW8176130.1 hypothetical protein [Gemmatales bacterium]MDW8222066.1 hypothetical protein [Gemmatales bacterium]